MIYKNNVDNREYLKKLDSIIAQVEEIERVYGWGINDGSHGEPRNTIFSDLIDDVKSLKDNNAVYDDDGIYMHTKERV